MALLRRISTPLQRQPQQSRNHNLLLPFCCVLLLASYTDAFTTPFRPAFITTTTTTTTTTNPSSLFIRPPPGSGYASTEDETSPFPDTYHPMMEYPGTMRPGTTPENMPYQDLPLADDDPDPVPWPHFQQIEWHHKWDAPHPHPIPMEEFIDMHGRWATPEMEAAMRAGVRRDIRERQEQEAAERQDMIITDDDDDDDDDALGAVVDEPIALGDGMFGQLGSAADEAITAAAVAPRAEGEEEEDEEEDEADGGEDDDLDNFLLDLGLDAEVDEIGIDMDSVDDDAEPPADLGSDSPDIGDDDNSIDMVSDGGDISATITVEDDDDIALGVDEEDDLGGGTSSDGVSTVPLDAFADSEDGLDGEDIFGDGGFDYDDGDFDDGDVW